MHDSLGMRGVKRVGDLDTEFQQLINGQWAFLKAAIKRLSFEQFHGDEDLSIALRDFVNGANVRMIERGSRARLASQALERMRVLRRSLGEKLERHMTAEGEVFALVADTHTPTSAPLET